MRGIGLRYCIFTATSTGAGSAACVGRPGYEATDRGLDCGALVGGLRDEVPKGENLFMEVSLSQYGDDKGQYRGKNPVSTGSETYKEGNQDIPHVSCASRRHGVNYVVDASM